MKLLLLLFQVSAVLCAVRFSCFPFEQARDSRSSSIKLVNSKQKTSVLIYKQIDGVEKTNIPLDINQNVIQKELNGFGVCNQKSFSAGYCSTLDKFTVKLNDGVDEMPASIINNVLEEGEVFEYEIKDHGFYCVAAYQEVDSSDIKGVALEIQHSYGKLPFEKYGIYETIGFVSNLSLILIGALWVWKYKMSKNSAANVTLSTPHLNIVALLYVSFLTEASQSIVLGLYNNQHLIKKLETLNRFEAVIGLVRFIWLNHIIYCFSLNESCLKENEDYGTSGNKKLRYRFRSVNDISGNFAKKFKTLLGVYSLHVLLFDVLNVGSILPLNLVIPLSLLSSLMIINPMIWIIYNKNFKLVVDDILDPIYLKNFKTSRRLFIGIPVTLSALPGFYQFTKSFTQTLQKLSKNDIDINNMNGMVVQSIDDTTKVDGFTSILMNSSYFTIFFICVALLIVWRPKTVGSSTSLNHGALELSDNEAELESSVAGSDDSGQKKDSGFDAIGEKV